MSAPCWNMSAATSVTRIIVLPARGVQGHDSGELQAWRAKLVTGHRVPVAPA